nr:MAG TPA: hypothetical protein [Caudoviricetes sp.]
MQIRAVVRGLLALFPIISYFVDKENNLHRY